MATIGHFCSGPVQRQSGTLGSGETLYLDETLARGDPMTKTLTALAAAATMAVVAIGAPTQANAQRGAVAAGIIGGLAAGAIIGSAVGKPYRHGDYAPG